MKHPKKTGEELLPAGILTILNNLAVCDWADVLFLGETGTGKSHAARALHQASPRRHGMFLPVNCAEIPANLIETELFGVERGAFTGAVARPGKFEQAHGGTLFLDEIGEFAPELQAKLLTVVERKEVTRVGGTRAKKVDVRLIYATNQPLTVFREDLRYRLAAHVVRLPPLRERAEAIEPFAQQFLAALTAKAGPLQLAPEALPLLKKYAWPGNLRQLRQVLAQAAVAVQTPAAGAKQGCLTREIIAQVLRQQPGAATAEKSVEPAPIEARGGLLPVVFDFREQTEAEFLAAYRYCCEQGMTQQEAARALGCSRWTLQRRLQRMPGAATPPPGWLVTAQTLAAQGLSKTAIARRLGLSERTVRRKLAAGSSCPIGESASGTYPLLGGVH